MLHFLLSVLFSQLECLGCELGGLDLLGLAPLLVLVDPLDVGIGTQVEVDLYYLHLLIISLSSLE